MIASRYTGPIQWVLRSPARRSMATGAAIGLIGATIYIVFAAPWYQSTLTVMPTTPSRPGFGAQLAGALGAAIDVQELGMNVDIERIGAVFESTSVTDAVINKFDLRKRYGERYIEQTRDRLWSHCSVRTDRRARLVSLSCEDKDPKFVQSLLEYFGTYGNEVFRRVTASSATEEARFLEKRVAEMRTEADESAARLRAFEERYKIVDLETQSKAVVSAMASLRSQEISKDLQLSYL